EIALRVLADQRRLQLGAVIEDDIDLVGIGDDVIVGYNQARCLDDEAGAERVDAPRRLLVATASAFVFEELIEELFHWRAGRQVRKFGDARIDFLRGRNVDHRIDYLLGNVGDVLRSARGCRLRRGQSQRRRQRGGRHKADLQSAVE